MLGKEAEQLLNKYELELTPTKIKPWGYTVGIKPSSIQKFAVTFFPDFKLSSDFLSPRFIVVNPNSRLSWQNHERRSELWKIIRGPIGILVSETDEQPDKPEIKDVGSIVQIEPNMRHRLVGLKGTAIVAETWVHLVMNNPSDANDIVRLDDDYER